MISQIEKTSYLGGFFNVAIFGGKPPKTKIGIIKTAPFYTTKKLGADLGSLRKVVLIWVLSGKLCWFGSLRKVGGNLLI
ncbi:MAG: hypothetical protein HDT44_08585 [Ruminococcaceae bacterium]|nr:hypothetical protein [Oscillospiraceae bacterium]